MRQFFLRLVLVLFLSGIQAEVMKGQLEETSPQLKKNTLSFIFSYHDFFDGHRILERIDRINGGYGYMPPYKGLEYVRVLGAKWSLVTSFRSGIRSYFLQVREIGGISGRAMSQLELGLQWKALGWMGWSLHLATGGSFRWGGESVLANILPGELLFDNYKLRDPGVHAGLRLQYHLPNSSAIAPIRNLVLATETKFTQIVWRYNSSLPDRDYFPDRSTRRMFTWQFGLGYRF